jgi:hypothetical protein
MGLFDGSSERRKNAYLFQALNDAGRENAQRAATESAQLQLQLGAGRDRALGLYDGLDERLANILRSGYGSARGTFQPFYDKGVAANDLYSNALGLGGQTGYDSAVGAFHEAPGYKENVARSLDNVQRQLSASGQSQVAGNTLAALSDRSRELQNDQWDKWTGGLNTLSNRGFAAAGQLGDLYAGEARGLGDVYSGLADKRAGLITGTDRLGVTTAANLWGDANANWAKNQAAGIGAMGNSFTAGDDAQARALASVLGIAKTGIAAGSAPFTGGTSGSTLFGLAGDWLKKRTA